MTSRFRIGDKVYAVALPNAFPDSRPQIDGLKVSDVRLVPGSSIADYYRVTAHGEGLATVEGAECFFEHEGKIS